MNYLEVYNNSFINDSYSVHDENTVRYQHCMNYLKLNKVNTIIDIGSGRGVMLKMIKSNFHDIKIVSADLNKYHSIDDIDFIKLDLSNEQDRNILLEKYENNKFDLLICLDVLEHLNKSFIESVINLFSKISKQCILTIANHSDILNGVELHTIQEDFTFWAPLIKTHFDILNYNEYYLVNNKPKLYIINCKSL